MIYITGDCHADFSRFTKHSRMKLPFTLKEKDYVIVCGDFGLLWSKDRTLEYNLDWLSRLPFTLLWVQGNHENYDMIAEYDIDIWKGGKVRHILRDKIILLERGQVFNIDSKKFFTFGGASSHDIQGGILDKNSPDYIELRKKAIRNELPYRVIGESWWKEELPSDNEMQEGRINLDKVKYKVDYVITHCMSTSIQKLIRKDNSVDIMTDYFEEIEQKLQYKKWYSGHYHINEDIDEKHTILYKNIVPIERSR